MNTPTLILRQTFAQAVDAYRELSARRLFWFSLVISIIVVAFFAMFDINDRGLKILGYQTPLAIFSTNLISREEFFTALFYAFGFGVWLQWAATALALISTAHVFPDFVSSGSIELTLSKPMARLRAFMAKYLFSLLFVALQVGVFSLASFIIIGVRCGLWDFRLFLGVPIMTFMFSCLFCVSALVGVVTRSALAALLVTGVVWLVSFVTHTVETAGLLRERITYDTALATMQQEVAQKREAVAALESAQAAPAGAPPEPDLPEQLRRAKADLADYEESLRDVADTTRTLRTAHGVAFGVKMFLPKTNECVDLLGGMLLKPSFFDRLDEARPRDRGTRVIGKARVSTLVIRRELRRELDARDAWWALGTSGGFQVVVLGLAAWIFARRDF